MLWWQWHQLDHMQIICISLQTYNHSSISPLSYYRPDVLPVYKQTNKETQRFWPPWQRVKSKLHQTWQGNRRP